MSDPTFVPLNTGDPDDDDATIFDEMLQQAPMPPDPAASATLVTEHKKTPQKPTPLFTSFITVSADSDPFPLVNTDLNRKELHIRVIGATTDSVAFADEPGKLAYQNGGFGSYFRLFGDADDIVLSGFTGPLYARTGNTPSNAVTIYVMAVSV